MKKILLSLSFLLITQVTFGSATIGVVEDQSELHILTPSLASRTTRKLRLENKLEVLLVSDPESSYAAAALSVGVGSSQDPLERPGLAHYTEHMLFLGNAKYPEEEGFCHFLDSHGGKRNAFTMNDRTVYMFSIANEGFHEGLDRFAHFFISPNFTSSGLQRECKAIHQEYCKNLPDDNWRMLHVKKSLCNQEHPFHGFSMGNLDTLGNVTHEEIKKWYDDNYSANLMRLCVYSNQSLDELEKSITPLFGKIENRDILRESTTSPLFADQKEPRFCFVTPVQERCCLELSWELPKEFVKDQELHSDHLLSYILGHEGEGTLLSQLKKEALVHTLACGTQKTAVEGALFIISMELTNKGVKNYEKVITHCFGAIQALQKRGIERYIYDEVKKIKEIEYSYQTRGDLFEYVMENAMYMIDESIETYPRKSILPTTFSQEAFTTLITTLTPQKAQYMLLAPRELTGVEADKEEKRMHVAYTEKALNTTLIKKWSETNTKCSDALPSPNLFLPSALQVSNAHFNNQTNFDLLAHEKSAKGMLYVAKDHCFLTPHASWRLHYKTPRVTPSLKKSGALVDLFVIAFNESVNERLYPAKLANLTLSLSPKDDGFVLSINGFEEKMALLIDSICKELTTMHLSTTELTTYKERLLKEYESILLESPLKQAGEITSSILYENYQSIEQKSEQIASITLTEINKFCKEIFKEGFLEATCYTSTEAESAKKIWKEVVEKLDFAPYRKEEQIKKKLARFSSMGRPTYLENRFPMAAGGLMVTLDFGDFTFEKRAIQEILSKALEEPFFHELRTKQQTAYIVGSWSQELERHLYNFFAIQSSSHDPRDLLSRFELFLESFLVNLEKEHLPKERFEMIKRSLVKQLTYPQFNFPMMANLFHTLAFEYEGDFAWLKKRVEALEELSYEDFLEKVQNTMRLNRQERLAVLIKGTFKDEAPFSYEFSNSIRSIKKRLEYK